MRAMPLVLLLVSAPLLAAPPELPPTKTLVVNEGKAEVTGFALRPDGKSLVAVDKQNEMLRCFDFTTSEKLFEIKATNFEAISPDGSSYLMTKFPERTLMELPANKPIRSLEAFRPPTIQSAYAFSPLGDLIVQRVALIKPGKTPEEVIHSDTLLGWDVATGKLKFSYEWGFKVFALTIFPKQERIVLMNQDGGLFVHSLIDGKRVFALAEENPTKRDNRESAVVTANESELIAQADRRPPERYDLATGKLIAALPDRAKHMGGDFLLIPDSNLLVGRNSTVEIWDYKKGEHVATLKSPDSITQMAISADRKTILASTHAGSICMWDMATIMGKPSKKPDTKTPNADGADKTAKPVPANKARNWTSLDGKFKVGATLVKVDDEGVHLKKTDGKTIVVPLEKLSDTDRKYLKSQGVAE